MKLNKALAAVTIAAAGAFATAPAQAVPISVGLELVLLVDVSGSVSTAEYNLQKTGYVNAFNSAAVQSAIAALPGGIAVTYIEWSGANQQSVGVGWTQVTNAATAAAFATAISNDARSFSGQTAPGSAINFAAPLFASNNYEGPRWVIDVSGDGSENDGANTATARNNFLASAPAGVTTAINGLPILGSESGLLAWYQNNIQGGTGSFTIAAASFADFGTAIQNKLTREITGVPEPGTLALLGLGLAGLAAVRRRKTSK